jgi:hypothetical protein
VILYIAESKSFINDSSPWQFKNFPAVINAPTSAAVNITGGSRKPSTRKYPFPASDPIGIPASSSVRISL